MESNDNTRNNEEKTAVTGIGEAFRAIRAEIRDELDRTNAAHVLLCDWEDEQALGVFPGAQVSERAWVEQNARAYGGSSVSGNAIIRGDAIIYNGVHVTGDVVVSGHVKIFGPLKISGQGTITGTGEITSPDNIPDTVKISGDVFIETAPEKN